MCKYFKQKRSFKETLLLNKVIREGYFAHVQYTCNHNKNIAHAGVQSIPNNSDKWVPVGKSPVFSRFLHRCNMYAKLTSGSHMLYLNMPLNSLHVYTQTKWFPGQQSALIYWLQTKKSQSDLLST